VSATVGAAKFGLTMRKLSRGEPAQGNLLGSGRIALLQIETKRSGETLCHHSQVRYTVPIFGPLLQIIANFGQVGVELFFAISGLLICSRLLDEESRFGQISVKGFYIRRFLRILRAAIFYLARPVTASD